jgi:hypothetical protein
MYFALEQVMGEWYIQLSQDVLNRWGEDAHALIVVGFTDKRFAVIKDHPYLAAQRPGQFEQGQAAGSAPWPSTNNHGRLAIA